MRTKDRPLWNTRRNITGRRSAVITTNILFPICEIAFDPFKWRTPYPIKFMIRICWSIVSNALLRSRKTPRTDSFFKAFTTSIIRDVAALVVECFARKPHLFSIF